jgi:hypothetical protein
MTHVEKSLSFKATAPIDIKQGEDPVFLYDPVSKLTARLTN